MDYKTKFLNKLLNKFSLEKDNIELIKFDYPKSIVRCKQCNTEQIITNQALLARHSDVFCKHCRGTEIKSGNKQLIKTIKNNIDKSPNIQLNQIYYTNINNHSRLTVDYSCELCGNISTVIINYKSNDLYVCKHCGDNARMTQDDFNNWIGNNYSEFILLNKNEFTGYNSRVHLKCMACGFISYPNVTTLRRNKHFLCPKCKHGKSRAELYIGEYLSKHNIPFKTEVNYDWLPNRHMRYDVILNDTLVIEYMGEQHYHFVPHFHQTELNFQKMCVNDQIKKEYALSHGLNYIAIPYTYDKQLSIILDKISSTTISKESRGKCLEIDDILQL